MRSMARNIVVPLWALACTGCVSIHQTESMVAVRAPGDRIIDELRPFAPEARRPLEYAWLSQAAYEKTEAAKDDPSNCNQDADQALIDAKWTPWKNFPDNVDLKAKLLKKWLVYRLKLRNLYRFNRLRIYQRMFYSMWSLIAISIIMRFLMLSMPFVKLAFKVFTLFL